VSLLVDFVTRSNNKPGKTLTDRFLHIIPFHFFDIGSEVAYGDDGLVEESLYVPPTHQPFEYRDVVHDIPQS
jgi:hypothetical protein